MKFDERFIYKKVQVESEVSKDFFWYLIARETREGVHFHGSQYKDKARFDAFNYSNNRYSFAAYGIEMHSIKPRYERQKPIEYYCEVVGGENKCYCDGSSLQASERLGWVNPEGSDDTAIWNTLHEYFDSWLGELPEVEAKHISTGEESQWKSLKKI